MSKMKVNGAQRRTYGDVEQEYSVEVEVDLQQFSGLLGVSAHIQKMLDVLFSQFEAESLKDIPRRTGEGGNIKVLPAFALKKNQDGDKVYYRLLTPKGTQFNKWGVPIYEEILEQYRLLDVMGTGYDEFPPGVLAHIQDDKRVIKLEGWELPERDET